MKQVIVGLGNPGSEYQNSRHNAGWMVLDHFAEQQGMSFTYNKKNDAQIAENAHWVLIKPQTYMNNSGVSVAQYRKYHPFSASDLLIVFDDLDLPLGTFKLSQRPPKVHNGVTSVLNHLGEEGAWYMRVGIDARLPAYRIPGGEYVLAPFAPEEKKLLNELLDQITAAMIQKSTH